MNNKPTIFLAGTIDDGKSTDWQKEVIDLLKEMEVEIYNPRRYDFAKNPTVEDVTKQIRWEQDHLDKADYIIMVFKDGSLSPITLLEMGLYAESGKLHVFCTENYWRHTNVAETCRKYSIPLIDTTESTDVAEYIKKVVSDHPSLKPKHKFVIGHEFDIGDTVWHQNLVDGTPMETKVKSMTAMQSRGENGQNSAMIIYHTEDESPLTNIEGKRGCNSAYATKEECEQAPPYVPGEC